MPDMDNKITSRFKDFGIQRFLDIVTKHAYLLTAVLCLMSTPFCFGDKAYITTTSLIYMAVVVLAIAFVFIVLCKSGGDIKSSLFLFGLISVGIGCASYIIYKSGYNSAWIFLFALLILAFVGFVLHINKCFNAHTFCILMILAGIVLRLCYVLYTHSEVRQHDVGYFNWTWGHANYIEYWYTNGLKLPDFDVRNVWQYYHPPLNHMIMALFLKILTLCGVEYIQATQALQILPLIYSSFCMIASYKLFKAVKLDKLGLIIATALICFHPTFFILAGSYNNDVLSVLFMLLAVNATLKWYNESTLKNIIPIALFIGFGMMTKLSAWMIAPAVAFIFLVVFIKNIKEFKSYILQFAIFALICFPPALWWQVRNLITFDVPLTYVPNLGLDSPQFVGNVPAMERLFGFTENTLESVFPAFVGMGKEYNDCNPTISLFKTAMFDEGNYAISTVNFPQIAVTATMLFYIGIVVALIATFAFLFYMLSKKTELSVHQRVFFLIIFAVFIVSYYSFCFKFPHVCTMNIRYCVPLIVLGAMGMGLLIHNMKTDSKIQTAIKYSCTILSVAFCVMSCIVYTQIG